MLPVDWREIPIFSMSVVTSILSFTAQMLSLVAMPFLLATTFHYDAVGTGLLMTSWPLVIVFVAPLAGLMIGKVHPGIGWGWVNYYECRLFLSFIYSYRNRALRACVAVDVVRNGFRIVPVSEQSYVA